MRAWWKSILIQELLMHLQARPNQTDEDEEIVQLLLKAVKGGAELDRQRGTLMNYLALLSAPEDSVKIVLPNQFKIIALRPLNIYPIVLHFLRLQFPHLNLISDAGEALHGIPFESRGARSYATVNIGAAKYGSSLHHRGKGFCYGYVDGRHAARVDYILSVTIPHQNPPVIVNLALIRRFQEPALDIEHPWSLSATDLGLATWKYNELGNLEACRLEDFTGQFAFARIRVPRAGHFWVTFSLDTTTQEPDSSDNEPRE
ncbi:hypothetical protein P692DRAFT_201865260 [Suillus brevipes Sb2]|nr:hypothetical protein P692DRAFT_201865260 [Suillus brevipes Sb2]